MQFSTTVSTNTVLLQGQAKKFCMHVNRHTTNHAYETKIIFKSHKVQVFPNITSKLDMLNILLLFPFSSLCSYCTKNVNIFLNIPTFILSTLMILSMVILGKYKQELSRMFQCI
jgi:hypothetical protein